MLVQAPDAIPIFFPSLSASALRFETSLANYYFLMMKGLTLIEPLQDEERMLLGSSIPFFRESDERSLGRCSTSELLHSNIISFDLAFK